MDTKKTMSLTELKSLYNDSDIQSIETAVEAGRLAANSAQRQFISALFYLERTSRFKESPGHRGSDFSTYLKDRFNLTFAFYNSLRQAFFLFPEESEQFGSGFVVRALRRCGEEKMPKVFAAIQSAQDKRKSPVPAAILDSVLTRFAKATAPITKQVNDWQAMYQKEHEVRLLLEEENRELKEQVQKLKATVTKAKNPKPFHAARAVVC